MSVPLRLSASIVTYHPDPGLLQLCLESFRQATDHCESTLDWALTVVDNGGNDIGNSVYDDERVTWVKNPANVGYGQAHNQIIRTADSTYHLIMNPDVILDPECLAIMISCLETNPAISLAGPRGLLPNGCDAHLCKRYPSILDLALRGFAPGVIKQHMNHRLSRYQYDDIPTTGCHDVELVSGCFMLARTGKLQQAGGFDPRFFLYFEDFDLSLAMAQQGQVVSISDATINHHGGNAARKGPKHLYYFCQSAFRFFNKHHWKLA